MDQLHFNPRSTSEEYLRRLRQDYPGVPLAKLVRCLYGLGEQVAQAEPSKLLEAVQADKRHGRPKTP